MKLYLVPEWRTVYRHGSSICMQLFLAGIAVFNALPERMQDAFSHSELKIGAFVLVGVGLVAKFFTTRKPNGPPDHD